MTKVFEGEVSVALHRLDPVYCHKCPDHPHAIPDKVDFLFCFRGGFAGIEAKEVQQRDECSVDELTANQRACLTRIDAANGFAALVVNFDRKRGVGGHVGFCFAWKFPDIPPAGGRLSIYDDNAILIPRVAGGWAIDDWIRRTM